MIEIVGNKLKVSFPEVHPNANCEIEFQRTLRVPDDGQEYPLPAGLGSFPLFSVEDHPVPQDWKQHGGIFLPMYQSEAMWLNFNVRSDYPFAVKVAAGKINAVTGEEWVNELSEHPQDYLSLPKQRWLDGFCVTKGLVRQFVATELGKGYSAEEQITGMAKWGGLQLIFYPMKAEVYEEHIVLPEKLIYKLYELTNELHNQVNELRSKLENLSSQLERPKYLLDTLDDEVKRIREYRKPSFKGDQWNRFDECIKSYSETRNIYSKMLNKFSNSKVSNSSPSLEEQCLSAMGFGAGGLIRQEIAKDPWEIESYCFDIFSRCYIHLLNTEEFASITGKKLPSMPITQDQYKAAGIPWFDYYLESGNALSGSSKLAKLDSIGNAMFKKGEKLDDNKPIQVSQTINLSKVTSEVNDGKF